MSRVLLFLGTLAAAIAVGSVARADDESGVLDSRHNRGISAQNFAFELRGASYLPRVDSDPALTADPQHNAPYARAFGAGGNLELALEMDWQALHIPHVGSLGPGLSIGYTSASALANLTSGGVSAETTSLDVFPMYGVAVFRLDVLDRDLHIPFVPYVKAGIGLALWRASNTGGTSVSVDGVVGKGHTWGTHVAAGLAFDLNILDQSSARQLDESTGINHTYIFGEYMMSDLNGLGQTHALYVGTHSWAFGLAFDF